MRNSFNNPFVSCKPITLGMIKMAATNLYGSWDNLSPDSIDFIEVTMAKGNFEQLYKAVSEEEKKSKETLIEFQQDYPGVATTENIDSIFSDLKKDKSVRMKFSVNLRRKLMLLIVVVCVLLYKKYL